MIKKLSKIGNKGLSARLLLAAIFSVAALTVALACVSARSQDIESAEEELRQGRYSAAMAAFNRILQGDPKDSRAQWGLVQANLETGQYAEAERQARKFLAAGGNEPQSRLLLGEILAITGRYREAIAEFEKARNTEEVPIKLRADLRRGEMLETTGNEDAARALYQSLVDYYKEESPDSAWELTLIARALTHLERYQDANEVYLEAIADDEKFIEAQLGGGELYTSKYQYDDAAKFYDDALKINSNSARTHLGLAANRRLEGGERMLSELAQALKINPNYVEARNFAASLDLEAEKFASAATQIDEALKINPNSLEARSLRAASFWLQDKPADLDRELKAIFAINPKYGPVYEALAHFATQTRRYAESVAFLREAVSLSPRLWSAHLALGIGLLRLGEMEEGRAAVEKSFAGDGFNIWAKNTLDLLDSMKDYRETKRGDFLVKVASKEADVLTDYAHDLLGEARGKLSAKYKFMPKGPISVEIFPNHEDFAVRALGLPGLGALGVCFGKVIAQDSPSARQGQFNWGSTLWHEYTHVITLQITDHLIPRWFSEGLSVFEEHNARPGWGDDWSAENIREFAEGRWFKISEIDNGFIRPKRPNDIALAYFEASQICHFINDRYGFDAILGMLRGYREKKKTPEILQQVLRLSEADFDREFAAYVKSKVDRYVRALEPGWKASAGGAVRMNEQETLAAAVANPDDFLLNLRAGMIYYEQRDNDKAAQYLKRAVDLFPYLTGAGNPYETLAEIYLKKGDKAAATAALESLVRYDENNYPAVKKLAGLRLEAGDSRRAMELLTMGFFIDPFEHELHTRAGDLLLDGKDTDGAIREFRIALGANPPNLAEAHYNIARAYFAAGRNAEAKRSVLRALEIAPGFDKAQDLLLKLVGQ